MTRLVPTGERWFAFALRLVPRAHRFHTALWLARATVPIFRATAAYREQELKQFHRPAEIVLFLLLNALTKNGTPVELDIAADGYQLLERAYAKGRGVLLIGHHAALTQLMVRWLHDKGLDPLVVTPDARLRVPGTAVAAGTIPKSRMFLVQLRTRLRRGRLVCAMPDRAEHHPGRTIEVSTAAGAVIIAPAILEVAARCGAEVLFTEVRVTRNALAATIAAPAASSAGDGRALTADFVSFVQDRAAASTREPSRRSHRFRVSSLFAARR